MRIIKKLSGLERTIIYAVVNSPPSGQQSLTQDQSKKRDDLFDAITKDAEELNGNYNFNLVEGKDLILQESERDELLRCFENTGYPTMQDKKNCNKIEVKIKNAVLKEDK